jgi:hypothetical protein
MARKLYTLALLGIAGMLTILLNSRSAEASVITESTYESVTDSLIDNTSITTLVEQTQLKSTQDGKITMMWWIPYQYWKISGKNSPSFQRELLNEWSQKFKDYLVIAVLDAKVSKYTGTFTFMDKEQIADSIYVRLDDGKKIFPLKEDKIDEDIRDLLNRLPSTLGNSMGELGRNLHFFVFNNRDKNNNLIVDVDKKMKLESGWTHINNFTLRLPLDLAVPPKFCPVDREKLSGKFDYCPYHGAQLVKK